MEIDLKKQRSVGLCKKNSLHRDSIGTDRWNPWGIQHQRQSDSELDQSRDDEAS